MSWGGDVLGFELFNGKKIGKALLHDPSRLLTGVDPASTGLWNTILGTHNHALVDQMGGATGQTYKDAEASGINTGPGHSMQNVAHAVAAAFALNGLSGIGGAGGGEAGVGEAAPSSGADVGGLAQLDSDAVAAEGAEPGLTASYGGASSSSSLSPMQRQMLSQALQSVSKTGQGMQQQQAQQRRLDGGSGIQPWNYVQGGV